jgi:hypothetical protein
MKQAEALDVSITAFAFNHCGGDGRSRRRRAAAPAEQSVMLEVHPRLDAEKKGFSGAVARTGVAIFLWHGHALACQYRRYPADPAIAPAREVRFRWRDC